MTAVPPSQFINLAWPEARGYSRAWSPDPTITLEIRIFTQHTFRTPKDFLENPESFFTEKSLKEIISGKPLKVFWKTLGKALSPKTLFGFPENCYGLFSLCEKTFRVFHEAFNTCC
jgi:hypothetical protein